MRGPLQQHRTAMAWLMKLLRQVLLFSLVPFFTATAQAVSVEYAYDGAYNRTDEFTRAADSTLLKHLKYHYDAAGRLTLIENVTDPSQSETLGYDDNGNQISRTVGMQQTLYGFDARDQLVSVEKRADNSPPIPLARYRYNADGMRVDGEEEGQVRRYSWDDDQLILTREPDNTLSRYQWGPNRLANLVSTAGGVTRRDWYFFDSLGSITALVSDAGELTATYRFDVFGKIRSRTGDSNNRFTYTGHQFDEVSDLYYFKVRYYDPLQGRFVSEDSYEGVTSTPESRNGYLYAYANPSVWVDLTGYCPGIPLGEDGICPIEPNFFGGIRVLAFHNFSFGLLKREADESAATAVKGFRGGTIDFRRDIQEQVDVEHVLKNPAVRFVNSVLTAKNGAAVAKALPKVLGRKAGKEGLSGIDTTADERIAKVQAERTTLQKEANLPISDSNPASITKEAASRPGAKLSKAEGAELGEKLKYEVGIYVDQRKMVASHGTGLDAHHVGQKARMKELVEGYDEKQAPSILVPKKGHTSGHPERGRVSTSPINPKTGKPFENARQVVARDINELRRVYPDIPNSKLQELIRLNKAKYPEVSNKPLRQEEGTN